MDEAAKRTALRMIPYALYAVGVRAADVQDPARDLNAFLGSWVTQCSFKPPLVAVGWKKGTRGHAMMEASRVFALSVLGAGQKDVGVTLMKDLEVTAETMSGIPYRRGEATGAPVFPASAAWVECRVVAVHDAGGDHDLVVGEVVGAGLGEAQGGPLTHAATGWHYGG